MFFEKMFFEKIKCLIKAVKSAIWKKVERLASIYKSGSLSGKLSKRKMYKYFLKNYSKNNFQSF